MNSLAIDTSSDYLSLAVSYQGRVFLLHEPAEQKHAELALPGIAHLLEQAGARLSELDNVIFGQGPGSFTGLRIACGLAQGLGFAASLPVIGIPTLDCIAAQAHGQVLVCMDARMNQVYTATYDTLDWQRLSPIRVSDPSQVTLPDSTTGWIGAGNGFSIYHDELTSRLSDQLAHTDPDLRPHAETLLRLADSGRYPAQNAREASLLYIRDKVALTTSEQLAARK
jgi:tRNA threonylcarbamoyladenosine biosynthesis protein TsaB